MKRPRLPRRGPKAMLHDREPSLREYVMERAGHLPGGVISEVANLHSGKTYMVSTAPEIGEDYWTTALMGMTEKRSFLGLVRRVVPDFDHIVATWTRNSMDDAYHVHAEVRGVAISIPEAEWFDEFPRPVPPDGYSEGAKARFRRVLGENAHIPE